MWGIRLWSFWKTAAALAVVAVAVVAYFAVPRPATAQGALCPPVLSSGMVSLLPGDVAVLSAVNAQPPNCPGEPVPLLLLILNGQGQILKQTNATVPAGRAIELAISYGELVPDPGSPPPRASVRAVISIGPAPQNQAAVQRLQEQMNQLQATFETISNVHRTLHEMAAQAARNIRN